MCVKRHVQPLPILCVVFVDPPPMLQRCAAKVQPTSSPQPPMCSHFCITLPGMIKADEGVIAIFFSSNPPTNPPMFRCVRLYWGYDSGQLPRRRGWYMYIPTPPTFRSLLMLRVMFVDPRSLLQRYVEKNEPTYPLEPPIPPAHFILNKSAHLPTHIPMLSAVPFNSSTTAATPAGPAYVYTHTTDVPMLFSFFGLCLLITSPCCNVMWRKSNSSIHSNHPHPQSAH